jgi:Xaa-Pro aminopeptidase
MPHARVSLTTILTVSPEASLKHPASVKAFTHGLGHSIGLQTHDPGVNLSQNAPEISLATGMTLTIEPGIYLEKKFGIRVEDTIVITTDGSRNLTSQSTEIIEI